MQNRIKIIWLCHFSNSEVRSNLSLSSNHFSNIIRKFIGVKKAKPYTDFAPWITSLGHEFERLENVELHIISPHIGLKKWTQSFTIRNIHYHFFKPDIPILHISADLVFKNSIYLMNRLLISSFIKKIKPDLINLIGAENPYYSIAILDIKNIPVYLSCQTVYSNPIRNKYSIVNEQRWNLELKIHRNIQYFGCSGRMHRDLVLKNNPKAIIFKMFFPIQKINHIKQQPKAFDFIFYAGELNNKKGTEDAIYALKKVKTRFPKITLNIVGQCTPQYKTYLLEIINTLDLKENIFFSPPFTNHEDLLTHITKSRFAILPNKLDVISGTIVESILLDIPVVTYKTSGSPYLNKNGQAVLLADIDDITTLAEQMIFLIQKPKKANQLALNARRFVEEEFDNTKSAKRLLSNYREVIGHYRNRIKIDENQLFDTNEFPLYE